MACWIRAGDARWPRIAKNSASLARIALIDALSLSLGSWGGNPLTIWPDSLTVA